MWDGDVEPRVLHQALELVRLTAEGQQQHAAEVRMVGIAEDRPPEQLEPLASGRHRAA